MAQLHYLTVQDMLWVNLQATKKVQHFNYAKLEEATYYQYAYGESSSLVAQAGRFLGGFLKLHPFEAGNESTGLIGCATFLAINGFSLNVEDKDALDWLDQIMTKQVTPSEAVAKAAVQLPEYHETLKPDIQSATKDVVARFGTTIDELAHRSAVAK
jgi:prophage maintenance system killer protein